MILLKLITELKYFSLLTRLKVYSKSRYEKKRGLRYFKNCSDATGRIQYTYVRVKDGTLECSQYVSIDHFSLNIHLVCLFVSRDGGREGGLEGERREPGCQL